MEFRLLLHTIHVGLLIHLISKITHYASANTGHFQIGNMVAKIRSYPHAQEDSNHLLACC